MWRGKSSLTVFQAETTYNIILFLFSGGERVRYSGVRYRQKSSTGGFWKKKHGGSGWKNARTCCKVLLFFLDSAWAHRYWRMNVFSVQMSITITSKWEKTFHNQHHYHKDYCQHPNHHYPHPHHLLRCRLQSLQTGKTWTAQRRGISLQWFREALKQKFGIF